MRACVFGVHTRVRPDPAMRDTAHREDEGGFTHIHTHGPHGRELCLARDVKLLAIS